MKLELTDDQRAMVDTVRQLAQEKFKVRVKKWQDGTFPCENLEDLAEIGVLGMAMPEEFGGMGLPVLDCVLVLEEVAKVCYVTAMAAMSAMGAQNRIIANYAPKHVHGGYGFTDEFPVSHFYRGARYVRHARRWCDRDVEGPRRQARLRLVPPRRVPQLRVDVVDSGWVPHTPDSFVGSTLHNQLRISLHSVL